MNPAQMNQTPQHNYPTNEIISFKENITQNLNYWRNRHIENVMAFHESILRRNQDPKQIIPTQQGDLSITKIAEIRLHPCFESKAHIEVLTAMLAEAERGDDVLAERWSNEILVAPVDVVSSPFNKKEGGEEETEGSKK